MSSCDPDNNNDRWVWCCANTTLSTHQNLEEQMKNYDLDAIHLLNFDYLLAQVVDKYVDQFHDWGSLRRNTDKMISTVLGISLSIFDFILLLPSDWNDYVPTWLFALVSVFRGSRHPIHAYTTQGMILLCSGYLFRSELAGDWINKATYSNSNRFFRVEQFSCISILSLIHYIRCDYLITWFFSEQRSIN